MSKRPPDIDPRDFEAIEKFVKQEITRKQALRRFGAGGALLSLPAWLAACGGGDDGGGEAGTTTTPAGEIKKGGRFSMARNEEPLSLDPVIPSDNGSIWVIYQIFDQLTTVNEDSSGVAPSIAESWEVSDDGTVYTFVIKQGVKFHDGSPMTIDDVVFSLERVFDPKGSGYSFLFGAVEGVTAPDDATVVITLKEPFTPLLDNLNVFPASIVPKAAVEADAEAFAQNPIGTGPFKLMEFSKGRQVLLAKHDEYWKPDRPHVDEVLIPYVTDDNTRILRVQGGEVDAAVAIPYAQIDQLDAQDEIDVQIEELFRFDGMWLNHAEAPLDDVKVRQALNYATDKEAMLKSIFFDKVEIANHMMPKMKYWREDVPAYEYDPERAQSLIAESKVPDGFTLPIVIPTGDVIIQQIAQIMRESYAGIGVDVQIENLDIGTAYTNFSSFNYIAGGNWYITSDVTGPDELAAIQFDFSAASGTKSFFTNYNSPRATELVNEAGRGDEAAREQAFGELQQLVMDDAVEVALFFTPARAALRSHVRDFKTVKTAWWRLEDVWLDA
ncbi:MAG: ABC transporter substrate-binding protein [Gaiellales bacterium]